MGSRVLPAVSTCVCTIVLLCLTSTAAARQPPEAQDGFVPVTGNDLGQEQLPATPLVFAAYAIVWVVLIVYVFTLWRRLARVQRELTEVSSRINERRP